VSAKKLAKKAGDLAEQIRARAYQIWESEGRPHGRAEIHWLQAESEVRTTSEPVESSSSKKKRSTRTQPRGSRS
jgi:hypothetical protein